MRTISLTFCAALASAACRGAPGDDPASAPANGDGDADDWGDDEDEIVDCDGVNNDPECPEWDPYADLPGEQPERGCEVEFPTLEPVWRVEVEVESGEASSIPAVVEMVASEDALFLANYHTGHGPGSAGSLERRTLTGELVWAEELQPAPSQLAWDGEHLYVGVGRELRRWSPDGVADGWRYETDGSIADVAVNSDTVAVVGSTMFGYGHDEEMDAFYGQVSKTMPAEYLGYAVPTIGEDDSGEAIGINPWGGWIAGGSTRGNDYHAWLHGYGGARFSASMRTYAHAHVEAMFPGDDVLYVVGWSADSPAGRWVSAFDVDGNELWKRDLWICPGTGSSFRSLALVDGELTGIAASRDTAGEYPPLIAKATLDGSVTGVWKLSTAAEGTTGLNALAVVGARVFVAGYRADDGDFSRLIAEVQP